MENTYEESFILRTWDVDRGGRLTLSAAFNFFQDIAGLHAERLGVGKDPLLAEGKAWILSRMSAVLERRPAWGSTVLARTWPRGTDRLFAIRDYLLMDEGGATIGRGRSAWLVVDLSKMRPLRPQALTDGLPRNEALAALDDGAGPVDPFEGLEGRGARSAVYSDLDYNGHVNNARYVQWIQDILPAEPLEGADRMRLDINYLAEIKPGATADLFAGSIAAGAAAGPGTTPDQAPADGPWKAAFGVEGRLRDPDQAAFRARLSLG